MKTSSTRKKLFTVLFILTLCIAATGHAQEQAIPDPAKYLNKEIGADGVLANWGGIESYYRKIAELSPRVSLVNMGKSTHKNNIIAAIITSEQNQKNLENLVDLQQQITWLEKTDEESWVDNKLFLLINCSMHSTEIGASLMSMKLLHSFASDDSLYTREALDNLVIVLMPSTNPDGINWITDWYYKWKGSEFEGLRYPFLYQEYAGHDNNRDWYMLNLKESQVVNRWMTKVWYPQLIWDMHQMGSNGWRAILPPFVGPPNPFIHPLVLTGVENAGHAMKYQMVTDGMEGVAHSQIFSIWWNGGFRNTPYFKNSIGLLTELASAKLATKIDIPKEGMVEGRRGKNYTQGSIINPLPWNGGRWGLPEIIAYELSAAKGLIKYASRNSVELIANYRRMCLDARVDQEGTPGGYVIPSDQHDLTAVNRLVDILGKHGIAVRQLAESMTFEGVDYQEGSIAVPGQQPFRPMIRSLLERLDYPENTEDGDSPYDINASTLPDIMAVEVESFNNEDFTEFFKTASLKTFQPLNTRGYSTSSGNTMLRASYSDSYRRVNEIIGLGGFVSPDKLESSGEMQDYFVQYDPSRDARAMDITGEIEEARKRSISIPRLGMLRGNLNSMSEGWTRLVLEQFSFPLQSVDEKRIKAGALGNDFDTMILPSIREEKLLWGVANKMPEGYEIGIGKLGLQSLEKFVIDGGTLICIGNSCRPVIKHFELPVADELRGVGGDEFVISGSLIKLDVNRSHPLAFGMPAETAVMFYNSLAFEIPKDSEKATVVASYAKMDTLIAGYAKGLELVAGLAAMVEVRHGDGRVVLIGFPCQFRGQTFATFKLLFNSLYNWGEKQEKPELMLEKIKDFR